MMVQCGGLAPEVATVLRGMSRGNAPFGSFLKPLFSLVSMEPRLGIRGRWPGQANGTAAAGESQWSPG